MLFPSVAELTSCADKLQSVRVDVRYHPSRLILFSKGMLKQSDVYTEEFIAMQTKSRLRAKSTPKMEKKRRCN